MTEQQHPITPPPELIKDWLDEWNESDQIVHSVYTHIAIRAGQWGADQELEACCRAIEFCAWFVDPTFRLAELRAARRPKRQSLKEQALALIDDCTDSHGDDLDDDILGGYLDNNALSIIRRALEALQDD